MRHENQHWNDIKAYLEIVSAGAGVSGLAPTARIYRVSDGAWWDGAAWDVTPTDVAMLEVDATNLPGAYYLAPGDLDYASGRAGYLVQLEETTTSRFEFVRIGQLLQEAWSDTRASFNAAGTFGEALQDAAATAAAIADAVWDEDKTGHSTADTFGYIVQVIAGLVHQNHRFRSPVYDVNGRLVSTELVVYPSNADAEADTNALTVIYMTSDYDLDGNLLSLLAKE